MQLLWQLILSETESAYKPIIYGQQTPIGFGQKEPSITELVPVGSTGGGLGGSPEVEVVGVGGPNRAAGDLREFFIREFCELFVQGFDFRFQDVQFFFCFHRYSSLDRYSNYFT